jgi:hypothetical protein
MEPTKAGQIAKFHTPLEDENPDQLYVVLEIMGEGPTARVDIKALNTGLSLVPINTVFLEDLIVVDAPTGDLIGHEVTITKADNTRIMGTVLGVQSEAVKIDMTVEPTGVATNVFVTIIDRNGVKHNGALFVTQPA